MENPEIKRSKKSELSLLNVIFCMLALLIHLNSYALYTYPFKSFQFNFLLFTWRLCSIIVQGFTLLSGIKFFLSGKDELPYLKYLGSRFRKIILPYTVCFIAYYLLFVIAYNYAFDIPFILKNYFTASLAYHLYFVLMIFQMDLLTPLWKKIVNKAHPAIVIPFSIVLSIIFQDYFPSFVKLIFPNFNFIYNDRIFTTYIAFYLIGCYIGKDYDKFIKMIKSYKKAVVICWLIAVFLFSVCTYYHYNEIEYVPFLNQVHTLYTLVAILMMFLISLKLAPLVMEKSKLLNTINKLSYNIYLWHVFIFILVDLFLDKLGLPSSAPSFAIILRIILVYPLTITLSLLIKTIFDKLKMTKPQ